MSHDRTEYIQEPTFRQWTSVFVLLRLVNGLCAGKYGDILPPELALEFREAYAFCGEQFELTELSKPKENENART